jgi:hypothetical protein
MKIYLPLIVITHALCSCNNTNDKGETKSENSEAERQKFFPVTAYIKGEIANIKKAGINPLKYTTISGHTDSVWLKLEELDVAVAEFLSPEIDTANLTGLFTEKSFLDQSINAITLTYDPTAPLPDTMKLTRWDVYIEPEANTIKRIYMVKQVSKTTLLQLTWINNQWCKIVSIVTDEKGVSKIEKEEKIIWDF